MTLSRLDRYEPGAVDGLGERAVVVGASLAGLCAARVLADAFEEVLVLERDRLPTDPGAREGAPQSGHPHAMLEAGRVTIEDLFPGFTETVAAEGGLIVDSARDFQFYDQGGFLADGHERLPTLSASRPLLEHAVREHARAVDGLRFDDDRRVSGFRSDETGGVTGVEVADGGGGSTVTAADLVVDARGRTSRTPQWLETNGFQAPSVDEVTVDVTYSTVRVERPPDDRRMMGVPPRHPRTRGGAAIPVEGDRWEVILQGVHGDDVPTDREEFLEFARSLPLTELAELLTEHEWCSETVDRYPFPSSRWRRYDRLDRLPDGLVVTGDAVASFNPIYGQGMSVAALDAVVLHHSLAAGGLADLPQRFFGRLTDVVEPVWQLAVGGDFEFPQTTGPKPRGTDLFNRYVRRLLLRAHEDGALRDAFMRVYRLERPATSLLAPWIVWRVLRPRRSR